MEKHELTHLEKHEIWIFQGKAIKEFIRTVFTALQDLLYSKSLPAIPEDREA